ncbi:MAG: hypothetical protein WA424_13795 [Candidatus Sulfotelmatobacter sp.]
MRNSFIVFVLTLCGVSQLSAQSSPPKPGISCEDESHALESGVYVYAVMDHIWPAAFPVSRGITVAVQFRPEVKVFLHTDGKKFELWTGTAGVPGDNVWDFLRDLADSCRLPPDPADAVKLLKIRWEAKELQRPQFEQLHKDLMGALADYVSTVRERSAYFMTTNYMSFPIDAGAYTIVYDNTWEHFRIEEVDLPINGQTKPMIKWVHEFQNLAEQTFHRSLGRNRGIVFEQDKEWNQ